MTPPPLVVRLEDQVGEPVANATLTAQVLAGEATFVSGATLTTDTEGEAQFQVQVGDATADLLVEVAAVNLDMPPPPVKFFATIGSVDTTNRPTDVTVSEATQVAFIADRGGGIPVIDVRNPAQPVLLHSGRPLDLNGIEGLVEARGNRLYVVASALLRLTIVDITDPRVAGFTTPTKDIFRPDAVLGILTFPDDAQQGSLRDFAIGNGAVYVMQAGQAVGTLGSLNVIDSRDETQPQWVTSLPLPTRQVSGVAVLGDVLYVAANTSGLLVYDVRDPLQPILLTSVAGDPDLNDSTELALASRLTIDSDFAYVVQTEFDRNTGRQTDRLLVVDLQRRTTPRVRGSVPLRVVSAEPTTPSAFTGTGLAVSGGFAYLARSALGLQVVDVRHPDAPRVVGFLDTPSQALQLTTSGDLIYVVDFVFGLQVIQGPGDDLSDGDSDGVIDFFDRFPLDAAEFLDSDGDGIGDNADPDDDNDGFSDVQEQQARPQTDPLDQLSFPVTPPPAGLTILVVDASSTLPASARNGTAATPYRAIREALQVIRDGQAPQVDTIAIRAGTYAASTTDERFPLDLSDLSQLTLQGAGRDSTLLDAGFVDDVITAERARQLTVDGLTLSNGVNGIEVVGSTGIVLRHSRMTGNSVKGGRFASGVSTLEVTDCEVDHNGDTGLNLIGSTSGRVIHNTLHDNAFDAINIQSAQAEVIGNEMADNGRDGVNVFRNASAVIINNRIHNSGRRGVTVQRNSAAEVRGNTITFTDLILQRTNNVIGLFVLDTTAGVTLTDNHVSGFPLCIALYINAAATITHNTLTDCDVGVQAQIDSAAEIVDNTIISQRLAGVEVSSSSIATLTANTLSDSPVGLLLQGQTSSATLRGGTITGSSYAAISLIGGTMLEMSLDSPDTLRIADNSGAGLLVADDASRVEFDSTRTLFEANGGGDIQGRGTIVDVADADTDGDGLSDSFERRYGFDPLTWGDGIADSDGDGLGDGEETMLAGHDPLNPGDAAGVVDLITNGGFEAEGGSLSGWTQINQVFAVNATGAWSALRTTTAPFRSNQVPPPQGSVAAIAESAAASSTLTLRQVIDIPPAASVVLGVDVLVLSGMPFATPEQVDLSVGLDTDFSQVGHQFRIDLLDPGAPDLALGDAVLAPLFRTEAGDPPIVNYRHLLFDLTPYAGRRVVLRFAHQQIGPVLVTGIDNVRLLVSGVAP